MIYDQGTAERIEDGCIIAPPFFGVIDAFDAPYHHKTERIFFDGMSGGEMVRKIILETFHSAKANSPLKKIILLANEKVGKIQKSRGISIDRSDLLAGCSFVFIKIKKRVIEIIQGGDCMAVWKYKTGEIGATKNQAYSHVKRNLKIIAKLMEKHKGNRKEMWVDFVPILSKLRKKDFNNPKIKTGFAVLNGQSTLKDCWQRLEIPIKNLEIILLFSDGLVPYAETAKEEELAGKVIAIYRKRRLEGLLQRKRAISKREEKKSHIAQDEATGIAIKFAPKGLFYFFGSEKMKTILKAYFRKKGIFNKDLSNFSKKFNKDLPKKNFKCSF
jgi:serine/threonine protein phosphatase PrpC